VPLYSGTDRIGIIGIKLKEKIIWEHGRRNFSLHRDGLLPIVCPIVDESEFSGVGIFNASIDEVRRIMDEDPVVKEGLFVYEVHDCRSFPGSLLVIDQLTGLYWFCFCVIDEPLDAVAESRLRVNSVTFQVLIKLS
jgi:hypothetical protein